MLSAFPEHPLTSSLCPSTHGGRTPGVRCRSATPTELPWCHPATIPMGLCFLICELRSIIPIDPDCLGDWTKLHCSGSVVQNSTLPETNGDACGRCCVCYVGTVQAPSSAGTHSGPPVSLCRPVLAQQVLLFSPAVPAWEPRQGWAGAVGAGRRREGTSAPDRTGPADSRVLILTPFFKETFSSS